MSKLIIHLQDYFLEKVLIERTFDFDQPEPEQISLAYDFDYEVKRRSDSPNNFSLTFTVRDDPNANTPYPKAYNLDLRITGFFTFDEGVQEKDMQYLIRFNGCTMLYGILRGMFSTITGTFPEGAIRLPAIMMDEVVKKVETRIASSTNSASEEETVSK